MAALRGVARLAADERPPPRTLALVDWADEEGARFGRSLFGSSAVAGTLDPAESRRPARRRWPRRRRCWPRTASSWARLECRSRRERLGAYLELHIEQGPVLEREGMAWPR